ncbi:MAG: 30S ribosomal protein S17 [Candidatus Peribacteraceae bacterium]|jgi:small subunit ribosomal protein S17
MRKKTGIITSAKMTGTVSVIVHRSVFHPLYRKRFRRSSKFLADTTGITDIQVGDTVEIAECRPLSKQKHFRVTEVLNRIPRVSEVQEEEGVEEAVHRKKEAPAQAVKTPAKKEDKKTKASDDLSSSAAS